MHEKLYKKYLVSISGGTHYAATRNFCVVSHCALLADFLRDCTVFSGVDFCLSIPSTSSPVSRTANPLRNQGVSFLMPQLCRNYAATHFLRLFLMLHAPLHHLPPKDLLLKMRLFCRDHDTPYMEECETFNRETKDGRDMKKYSEMLSEAIHSIVNVNDEKDICSLDKSQSLG